MLYKLLRTVLPPRFLITVRFLEFNFFIIICKWAHPSAVVTARMKIYLPLKTV
jgi:hypothetical protein